MSLFVVKLVRLHLTVFKHRYFLSFSFPQDYTDLVHVGERPHTPSCTCNLVVNDEITEDTRKQLDRWNWLWHQTLLLFAGCFSCSCRPQVKTKESTDTNVWLPICEPAGSGFSDTLLSLRWPKGKRLVMLGYFVLVCCRWRLCFVCLCRWFVSFHLSCFIISPILLLFQYQMHYYCRHCLN